MKAWALAAAERFLSNIALYAGLALAASALVGVVAAAAGDGVVTGQNGTIVYAPNPAHDPPGTPPTVETPNDDPNVAYLVLFPVLGVFYAAYIAPLIAGGLVAAEVLSALRVPTRWTRIAAIGVASLLALATLANLGTFGAAVVAVGMVTFAVMFRLPERAAPG